MTKEDEILSRHMLDLADQAWNRDIPMFTDFLSLHEQNIFHSIEDRLTHMHCRFFGGYEQAERQMLGFLPDAFCFDEQTELSCFPLSAVSFRPLNAKFSDTLTHRDYLGAMMNLGIDRTVTGDILVGEQETIVICRSDMAQLLIDELIRVKHTSVYGTTAQLGEINHTIHVKTVSVSVASARIDALISDAFACPRSAAAAKVESKEVYADGALVTKPSYLPREGTLISVRGLGRFRVLQFEGTTRKGRQIVSIEIYC